VDMEVAVVDMVADKSSSNRLIKVVETLVEAAATIKAGHICLDTSRFYLIIIPLPLCCHSQCVNLRTLISYLVPELN